MNKDWTTRIIHSDAAVPGGFRSLATPVYRGSTTLFSDASKVTDQPDVYQAGYTYGLYGTPTTLELAGRICELEGGFRTLITPGGQCAISTINFAFLKSGDHILVPESVYGPHRKLTRLLLRRFGVETTFYSPLIGREIEPLLQANTRMVWCESPGSITMEVQDIPSIAAAAHAHGALVAMDNTWAAGVLFDALGHGVDVTMQAITKYIGGHSDLLLGAITVKDESAWRTLTEHHQVLGAAASPDDCSLALRGMKTMAVRLHAIESSALHIARWLSQRPEIERVLHPALSSCPGHEFWKRDFQGSSGLFSVLFKPGVTRDQVLSFVNALELFEIGYSWGGFASLAVAYDFSGFNARPDYGHRVVRLHIGLENRDDLIADLERGLEKLR
jgi:cystathionine beta-lyase